MMIENRKHYYAENQRIASKVGSGYGNKDSIDRNDTNDRNDTKFHTMLAALQGVTIPAEDSLQVDFSGDKIDHLNGGGGREDLVYYYTGNHLSSTQLVTDGAAVAVQQVEYAPFGEVVNEYNIDWSSGQVPDFKFNAKELDEENGMYYFEHRYHAPPTFISRDKYFSKMPFMSPYAYCANNPVGLVDLTGDSVILRGPNVAEALAQMQSASQNIAMTLGDNGTVLASVNDGTKLSKKEQYMLSILNSSSTTTEITAQASGQVAQNISMEGDVGGAFMGTELSTDGNSATSHNVVNVHQTAANDRRVGASGNFIWHEIAEGYRAAQLSVKRQTSASMALMQGDIFGNRFSVGNDKIYQKAHQRAGRYWGGRVIPVAYTGHCYQANIVEQDKWSQYIHPHKSKYEFKKVPCINHYEIGN